MTMSTEMQLNLTVKELMQRDFCERRRTQKGFNSQPYTMMCVTAVTYVALAQRNVAIVPFYSSR